MGALRRAGRPPGYWRGRSGVGGTPRPPAVEGIVIDTRHRIRETLRFLAGLGILGTWVVLSFTMLLVAQLMSLDEEWTGWGDVFLNPYIVLPYIGISGLGAMALW